VRRRGALGRIGPDARAAVPALAQALRGGDAALAAGGGAGARRHRPGRRRRDGGPGAAAEVSGPGAGGQHPGRARADRAGGEQAVPGLEAFLRARLAAPAGGTVEVPNLEGESRPVGPGGEVVAAIDTLGAIGPDAAPAVPLLLQLVGSNVPERARAAVTALARVGKETLPELAKAVRKASPQVRGHYLDVLVEVGLDAGVVLPPLLGGLKDDDVEVRQRAAFNLGRLGPKAVAAVKPLAALLADPKEDGDLRGTAAQAAGARSARRRRPPCRRCAPPSRTRRLTCASGRPSRWVSSAPRRGQPCRS